MEDNADSCAILDEKVVITVDGNVCTSDVESFGDKWTIIPRTSWKYWWYRLAILYSEVRAWWLIIRCAIKSYGWRMGAEYIYAVADVYCGRSYDSIDWRRFGIYTMQEATEAGICPPSILDIDIDDEKWKDAVA